jgi:putative endonuclease
MKPLLPQSYRQKLGKIGEQLAVSYLHKHGYRIVQQNFKARYGEIDIICTKENTLIFVEVKTRIGEKFGKPEESVTPRKLREVIQTAQFYVQTHDRLPQALRIDVIAIQLDDQNAVSTFHHIQSVT